MQRGPSTSHSASHWQGLIRTSRYSNRGRRPPISATFELMLITEPPPALISSGQADLAERGPLPTTYSADEPERLRGPQHDAAWCDEIASWRYPEAWDMLMFGLRADSFASSFFTLSKKEGT
jgi:phage terminase large subunit-like protein